MAASGRLSLFEELVVETHSGCNRACPTCLRQTYPGRAGTVGQMQPALFHEIVAQAGELGFHGTLCLQFFDEPLLDTRIADFASYALVLGTFLEVYANTNGDHLPAVARQIDGAFDRLHVALYGEHKRERAEQYCAMLHRTALTFTQGEHVVTHHWPDPDVLQVEISRNGPLPCVRGCRKRMIIGWDGRLRLCCEDIEGVFDLGSVVDMTMQELWFGDKHRAMLETLNKPGGRAVYPYCAVCPRKDK